MESKKLRMDLNRAKFGLVYEYITRGKYPFDQEKKYIELEEELEAIFSKKRISKSLCKRGRLFDIFPKTREFITDHISYRYYPVRFPNPKHNVLLGVWGLLLDYEKQDYTNRVRMTWTATEEEISQAPRIVSYLHHQSLKDGSEYHSQTYQFQKWREQYTGEQGKEEEKEMYAYYKAHDIHLQFTDEDVAKAMHAAMLDFMNHF